MKLAQVTTIREMLAYAKAEYADAQKYCNKTATLAIYSQTVAYLQSVTSMIGTSNEYDYVSTAKSMLESARTQWYNDGCAAPGSSSSSGGSTTPAAPSDETSGGATAAGIGGLGTWLLAGLGLLAVWYLMKNKGGAKALPVGKKRRAAKARKIIRRRRRPATRKRPATRRRRAR